MRGGFMRIRVMGDCGCGLVRLGCREERPHKWADVARVRADKQKRRVMFVLLFVSDSVNVNNPADLLVSRVI